MRCTAFGQGHTVISKGSKIHVDRVWIGRARPLDRKVNRGGTFENEQVSRDILDDFSKAMATSKEFLTTRELDSPQAKVD